MDLAGMAADIGNYPLQGIDYLVNQIRGTDQNYLSTDRPFGGSAQLIDVATKLGLSQQPTGSAPETLGRVMAGLINPMAGARAVGRVGEITTEQANRAADALVRQITGNPTATAPQVLQETSMPFMQAVAPKSPKYFTQIPDTSEEIDRITGFLEKRAKDSGFDVKTGASNISGSRYVTITKDLPDDEVYSVEVRISNHGDRYPSNSWSDKRFSIDPDTGNTLQDALQFLKDEGFAIRKTIKPEKKITDSEIAKKYYGISLDEYKNLKESRGAK
jgi:hypothetical protein